MNIYRRNQDNFLYIYRTKVLLINQEYLGSLSFVGLLLLFALSASVVKSTFNFFKKKLNPID